MEEEGPCGIMMAPLGRHHHFWLHHGHLRHHHILHTFKVQRLLKMLLRTLEGSPPLPRPLVRAVDTQ